jgi:dUTP pyrophosphatase
MALDVALDQLQVKLLSPAARAPARTRPGDAAYDLRCSEGFSLWPREVATVPTGVAVALPPGIAGLVVPRSGLAARHGISVVNGPGLIDSGFRGELRAILLNTDATEPFTVEPGMRIAQLVLVPVAAARVVEVGELTATARGTGGLGSSGA